MESNRATLKMLDSRRETPLISDTQQEIPYLIYYNQTDGCLYCNPKNRNPNKYSVIIKP